MITVIHGDDLAASRSTLHRLRESNPKIRTVPGSDVDLTLLAQLFESDSLFDSKETIVIEGLLTGKKSSGDLDPILSYLSNVGSDNEIYLWEAKEVGKAMLSKLKGAKTLLFKLPQSLFQFLDAMRPGNSMLMIRQFHNAAKTAEPELLFAMMIRQFRLLLGVTGEKAAIDEVKRLQPWQLQKLTKQSDFFSPSDLKNHIMTLHKIDLDHKTGAASYPLSHSIDIFLTSL